VTLSQPSAHVGSTQPLRDIVIVWWHWYRSIQSVHRYRSLTEELETARSIEN
jgi:hypothetical protein